jgi:predicted nucleic acid-binding protein
MIIVVDSNIVFSGLLSPEGTISDFLLNSNDRFEYCAPSFLIKELSYHQEKILKN